MRFFSKILLYILKYSPLNLSYREVGPRVTSSQILNHQPTTLNGVSPRETSFWLLAMTSALWRHHSGFLRWPRLCGDVISDLNFHLIPWPIEYLDLLEIFSIWEGTLVIDKFWSLKFVVNEIFSCSDLS